LLQRTLLSAILLLAVLAIGGVYALDQGGIGRLVQTVLAALGGAAVVAILIKPRPAQPLAQTSQPPLLSRILRTLSIAFFLGLP